jgi:hypothetical protein
MYFIHKLKNMDYHLFLFWKLNWIRIAHKGFKTEHQRKTQGCYDLKTEHKEKHREK